MTERTAPTTSSAIAQWGTSAAAWRPFIWAGIGAPILFFIVFTLDGALTPGYSAYNEAISYLEVGGTGWIQRANFLLLGLLLIGFTLSYAQRMRGVMAPAWVKAVTVFLLLSGLGWIIASLFAPNPYLAPQLDNLHAYLHQISFIAVFMPFAIASIIAGVGGLRVKGWRGYGVYSLVNGLVLLVLPIGSLSYLIDQSFIGDPNSPGGGLFQRIGLAIFFAWFIITAIRLLLRERGAAHLRAQVH